MILRSHQISRWTLFLDCFLPFLNIFSLLFIESVLTVLFLYLFCLLTILCSRLLRNFLVFLLRTCIHPFPYLWSIFDGCWTQRKMVFLGKPFSFTLVESKKTGNWSFGPIELLLWEWETLVLRFFCFIFRQDFFLNHCMMIFFFHILHFLLCFVIVWKDFF